MTVSVEWRIDQGTDAIVVVDEDEGVSQALSPDADVLKEFLKVTNDLSHWRQWAGWHSVERGERDPKSWGDLAICRSAAGDVTNMDPELFWEGVRRWFRSRGVDYNT